MDALDNFYTDQSFVDWYKTTKDIKNVFWTWWLSILRIPLHTNILCKSLRVY